MMPKREEIYIRHTVTLRPRGRMRTFAVAMCAGLSGLLYGPVARAETATPIDTTSGPVVGLPADARGISAYLGIPYAEPPTGELRFLPPVPVKRSKQVIQATHLGPASAQRADTPDRLAAQRSGRPAPPIKIFSSLNEDSLTVNVWTPDRKASLPVMVWIHGGGDTVGSGHINGAPLAAAGNVVVVSLNYRLGIFGFVDVSVLGGERYKESSDDGLLDQLQALRWVQQNIAHFGGDPNNVTVFGGSAGGTDISALLAVDHPEQYFHRAIMQSGFANFTKSLAVAQRLSRDIFERAHVTSIKQLLAMRTEELLAMQVAATKDMTELENDASFQPTVDGTLVKEFSLDAIRHGNARKVDLLMGSTANELRLYLVWNPEWKNAHLADIVGLKRLPESVRQTLFDTYRAGRPNMSDGFINLDIAGDFWFRAGALRVAEEQVAYNKNVYMYLVTWPSTDPEMGSPHGEEGGFVFGGASERPGRYAKLDDPSAKARVEATVAAVQGYWTSFARTGVPAATGAPLWPRYDTKKRETMMIDRTLSVASDPMASERKVLSTLNLHRVDW